MLEVCRCKDFCYDLLNTDKTPLSLRISVNRDFDSEQLPAGALSLDYSIYVSQGTAKITTIPTHVLQHTPIILVIT